MTIGKRVLGRTGYEATVLGYGGMELGGPRQGPPLTDEAAERVLNAVLDAGINLIDTSVDYGRSEELIGRFVSHRRDEYFLASKCGCRVDLPPGAPALSPHDYRPANVRADVEQSLRRLNTDRLDLVQIHLSPSRAQLETDHTVETLETLRDEGKIRFIGMSGILPDLRDHIAMGAFDVFQIPYSAVQREHEELISEAARSGAGTLIRGGAARGAPSPDKQWRQGPLTQAPGVGRQRWETSSISELLGDMSSMEFTLRFTLSHPDLSSAIVGTANPDHLRANVAVAEKGPLPPDLYQAAKARLAAVD